LDGWYDATVPETITQSVGAVSQWLDKSGKGNHAIQSQGSRQPATGTRTINGLNALDFANDRMVDDHTSPVGRNIEGALIICVIDPDSGTQSNTIYEATTPNQARQRMTALINSDEWGVGGRREDNDMYQEDDFAVPAYSNAPHIFSAILDYANAEANVCIDGTLGVAQAFQDAGFTDDTDANRIAIGGRANGNTQLYDGLIGEIVVVRDALQFSRERVEGYLAWKWGMVAQLDAGHPYKAAPPVTP
jgi:hypothetical protein